MMAYYNEIDPEKAQWIRELIAAGVVAPGDVDERDIKLVQPDDLRGYRQCHFFAGIAVWSYALRLAGWPDDRECWTGSCPCPSFSSAGKGQGFDDARHLWPDWVRLIRECKPSVVFGEQADDAIGFGWLDLVQAQMEAENYALGKAVLASASVGAADLRERLYFVADAISNGTQRPGRQELIAYAGRASGSMADSKHTERWPVMQHRENGRNGAHPGRSEAHGQPGTCSEVRGMADSQDERCGEARPGSGRSSERAGDGGEHGSLGHAGGERLPQRERIGRIQRSQVDSQTREAIERRGILGGFWGNAEWIWCRDEKYRPVEPAPLSMADGLACDLGRVRLPSGQDVFFPLLEKGKNRVLRLRGYGDAINSEVAQQFIRAFMESR